MSKRPSPVICDRDTGPFFAAASESRLDLKVCRDCDRGVHPPMAHCPWCGGWNTGWKTSAGRGTLHSWSVTAHQIHPGFPAPYTLVLVTVDDVSDVRLVGSLAGAHEDLEPGQPMQVWFDTLEDGAVIPQWRPVANRSA